MSLLKTARQIALDLWAPHVSGSTKQAGDLLPEMDSFGTLGGFAGGLLLKRHLNGDELWSEMPSFTGGDALAAVGGGLVGGLGVGTLRSLLAKRAALNDAFLKAALEGLEKSVKSEAPLHFEGALHRFSPQNTEYHHACKGEGCKECKK